MKIGLGVGVPMMRRAKKTGGGGDPGPTDEWMNTVLLMDFEGPNNSTSFIDEGFYGFNFRIDNGSPKIDTGVVLHGSSSLLSQIVSFNGASVSGPGARTPLEMGDGPFTVEFMARWSNISSPSLQGMIAKGSTASIGPQWGIFSNGGKLQARLSTDTLGNSPTIIEETSGSLLVNTTYTIAMDRDESGVVRLYIDGNMVASGSFPGNFPSINSSLLYIMRPSVSGARDFVGSLDKIRITKGIARYASDSGYTPSSAAFERDTTHFGFCNSNSTSSTGTNHAARGNIYTAGANCTITDVRITNTATSSRDVKVVVAKLDGSNIITSIEASTSSQTLASGEEGVFPVTVNLSAGDRFMIFAVRTDSTATAPSPAPVVSSTAGNRHFTYVGYGRLESLEPAVNDNPYVNSTDSARLEFRYTLT